MLSFHSSSLFLPPIMNSPYVRAVYSLGKKDGGRDGFDGGESSLPPFFREKVARLRVKCTQEHVWKFLGFANFRVRFIPSFHFSSLAHSFCHRS